MKEHADDVTLHMLPPPFFDRPADVVARELIGVRLVRRLADRTITTELTETEAYLGPHDLACHAAKGRSKRNDALYGPPGTLYVYLCYGIHWMLNFVTGDEGYPAAVLARGSTIASGPGRLTAALAIDRALDGQPMGEQTGLWLERPDSLGPRRRVIATPRIGIDYAGPLWVKRKLRYVADAPARRADQLRKTRSAGRAASD